MFVTTGAKLVKGCQRRNQQPERADAMKSQVDIARSIGSAVFSLCRTPVSSPSPAEQCPLQVASLEVHQHLLLGNCSQNVYHLEMRFLPVLLSKLHLQMSVAFLPVPQIKLLPVLCVPRHPFLRLVCRIQTRA